MNKLAMIFAFTLALAGTGAALAQDKRMPTGSRVGRPAPAITPGNTQLEAEDRARVVMNQLADCIYRSDRRDADLALSFVSETKEGGDALRKVSTRDCYLVAGDLRVPLPLLRGALFRAKFIDEFGDGPITFGDEQVDFAMFVPNVNEPVYQRFVLLGDFAGCVVRADPANARRLVVGPIGDTAEEEALKAVLPHLGPCLSAGLKVQFSKSVIAALLAEAMYREAEAGRAISEGGGQ